MSLSTTPSRRRRSSFANQLSCLFCPAWGCTFDDDDDDKGERTEYIDRRTRCSGSSSTRSRPLSLASSPPGTYPSTNENEEDHHEEWRFASANVDVDAICDLDKVSTKAHDKKLTKDLMIIIK